jgi:hypothetical protein
VVGKDGGNCCLVISTHVDRHPKLRLALHLKGVKLKKKVERREQTISKLSGSSPLQTDSDSKTF